MRVLPLRAAWAATAILLLLVGRATAQDAPGADPDKIDPDAPVPKLPGPDPLPKVALGPMLPTHAVRRSVPGPNWVAAEATVLPLDRKGIYVLEYAFKPLRMIEVDIPGKGRRRIHYLYYRVVNRTGQPRMFVPQFSLVTNSGQRFEDVVLPQAVKNIQSREAPEIDLLSAVSVVGMIPPSTKEGIDDAVYGVAVWDNVDFRADGFKIFVRGLSDGYQEITPPDGGKPFTRYKALRIGFTRPGDERNPNEKEIRLLDPPYEWTYYP